MSKYGITPENLEREIILHKKAREEKDKKMMQKIEHYLTDINFHYECGLISDGKYEEALNAAKIG